MLMQSISMGAGKEQAVFGVFKFAHVLGAVVGAICLMSVGIVAASGGPDAFVPFGGGDEKQSVETAEFKGEVTEFGEAQLVILTAEGPSRFGVNENTVFKNAKGERIDGVEEGDRVYVLAKEGEEGLTALKVRILPEEAVAKPSPTPKPSPKPEATHAPKPTPVHEDEPVHEEEPPPPAAPAEAVFEGWVKEVGDGYLLLKQPDYTKLTIHVLAQTVIEGSLAPGATARVEALVYPDGTINALHIRLTSESQSKEFWGVVVSMGDSFMILNTEFGQTKVWWGSGTAWSGEPFNGVKVLVNATKKPDGSYLASKIVVKTAEISGTVVSVGAGSMTVNAWDTVLAVKWNGETAWQGPDPYPGAQVWVAAYKLGDGTYLASKIVVKPQAFNGVITAHTPGELTIHVKVEGVTKVVCYEFADVIGTLAVGKTVHVQVDHTEGGTYFASLVKVIS
jgi:hypothetical protein